MRWQVGHHSTIQTMIPTDIPFLDKLLESQSTYATETTTIHRHKACFTITAATLLNDTVSIQA